MGRSIAKPFKSHNSASDCGLCVRESFNAPMKLSPGDAVVVHQALQRHPEAASRCRLVGPEESKRSTQFRNYLSGALLRHLEHVGHRATQERLINGFVARVRRQ